MRIPHRAVPETADDVGAGPRRGRGRRWTRSELPFAFVMAKDAVRDDGLDEKPPDARPPGARRDLREHGPRPTRVEMLERFLAVVPDDGRGHRHHREVRPRALHARRPAAAPLPGRVDGRRERDGARRRPQHPRPVVVLDGDGAALMKLGNLATIGSRAPANLVHVVLDNGVHDSTGGQATVSASVDFAAVALACGYASGATCDSRGRVRAGAPRDALGAPGPASDPRADRARVPGEAGAPDRSAPAEVARRFRRFLAACRLTARLASGLEPEEEPMAFVHTVPVDEASGDVHAMYAPHRGRGRLRPELRQALQPSTAR